MKHHKSLHPYLLAIALGVLALTGCSAITTTSPEAVTPDTNAPNNPIQKANQIAAGQYAGLAKIVTDTTTAVTAGDFATAKTEFSKFAGEWEKLGGAIKVMSPAAYETIENNVNQVTTALQTTQPAKDQVLTSLQTLTQTISTLGK